MTKETAMKILKELHDKSLFAERTAIETIIPELKDSEDERIRKDLLAFIKAPYVYDFIVHDRVDPWIAWLEKQGKYKDTFSIPTKETIISIWELGNDWKDITHGSISTKYGTQLEYIQKHWQESEYYLEKQGEQKDFAPKQELKFKIGDFIVYDYCMGRVVEITNDAYLLDIGQGIPFSCEDNMHLWTIKDANEGNILAGKIDGDSYILIFKTIKDGWIETYGHYYNAVNRFCVPSQLFCRDYQGTFTPATKAQRDILLKAMADAGFEWNAEKKELKKIDDEIEIPFGAKDSELQEETYYIPKDFHAIIDDDKVVIKKGEKSATWSDEDEKMYRMCIDAVEYYHTPVYESAIREWLKSLKDRIRG